MQVKNNPKADLSRNSFIFFQIGLIIILGIIYIGIEWKFVENDPSQAYEILMPEIEQEDIPVTAIKDLPPPPPPPPAVPEVIEVIENDLDVEETEIQSTESNLEERIEVIEVAQIVEEELEETVEEVPFVLIEDVPIFPGCEKFTDNQSRKNCMSSKIDEFIHREFNTDLGAQLNLYGINKIYVVFRINEKGLVSNIQVRGPHRVLEQEAERVIKLLPRMTPGKQRNIPASVVYTLPITFEVINTQM
ncbi:energy transducer TonB [Christiangramia sabulilitoris]|uniref:Energy transducer TonB n=1 Tax=Christiangramia sabulilitoris TaxID=2583991 RepID=A0A550I7M7_9FLAO|nr:energy transducer TonB [Christiangramia sabulilitoris]TRO66979.1 energy transducer TonB [Christiangramia sabulilitoris]